MRIHTSKLSSHKYMPDAKNVARIMGEKTYSERCQISKMGHFVKKS